MQFLEIVVQSSHKAVANVVDHYLPAIVELSFMVPPSLPLPRVTLAAVRSPVLTAVLGQCIKGASGFSRQLLPVVSTLLHTIMHERAAAGHQMVVQLFKATSFAEFIPAERHQYFIQLLCQCVGATERARESRAGVRSHVRCTLDTPIASNTRRLLQTSPWPQGDLKYTASPRERTSHTEPARRIFNFSMRAS